MPYADPVQRKAVKRAEYLAQADVFKARGRLHYRANRSRRIEQVAAWRVANPERRRLYGRRNKATYRARIGGWDTSAVIGPEAWACLWETQVGRCNYCLGPATGADHVIPVCKGGLTDPSNLVLACKSCNYSKGAALLLVWFLNRAQKVA